MTAIDTKLWNLQDMLRKLGFTPEEHGPREYREDWYIQQVRGGTHHVRVVIHPDDGHRVEAHYLDRHYFADWSVNFNGGTPHSVIRASVRAMVNA